MWYLSLWSILTGRCCDSRESTLSTISSTISPYRMQKLVVVGNFEGCKSFSFFFFFFFTGGDGEMDGYTTNKQQQQNKKAEGFYNRQQWGVEMMKRRCVQRRKGLIRTADISTDDVRRMTTGNYEWECTGEVIKQMNPKNQKHWGLVHMQLVVAKVYWKKT